MYLAGPEVTLSDAAARVSMGMPRRMTGIQQMDGSERGNAVKGSCTCWILPLRQVLDTVGLCEITDLGIPVQSAPLHLYK